MTNRQKAIGCPEWAVDMARNGEWLRCSEAMLAKLATVKRGVQYRGTDLIKMWLPEYADMPVIINMKRDDAVPMWLGLSALYPERFNYTCTHSLDLLWVY